MNVSAVAFHSEGKWLVTASEDGTIKVWDLRYAPYFPRANVMAEPDFGPFTLGRPLYTGLTITVHRVCGTLQGS